MSSLKNKKIQSAAQLLLAALLLFQLAACAARRGAPAAGSEEYATFRDVPGVTADEIAAIEEISAQSAVLLYGMTSSTECFFDNASNSNKGYAVLFCKWLTDFFGVRFRPNIYEWDVLMRGLDSGEIQFSGDISSRMTAADGFYSTDAIAERRIVFVSSDGMTMTRRRVENDNRQMRYGFLKGASAYEIVAPYLGEDAEFVEISDYVDMRQKLMLGQIDALAMDETVDVIFPPDDNFVTETFEPIAFNSVSMATADERYAPFISVLQKYLDAAGTYKLRDMYEDGRTVYLQYRLHQRLGDAHFSYIDAHATAETAVRIAIDRDDYPV
ncbi:MAG: transporter substrate-binding domain-containing protein, partial [Oscillospiraceae bacterium]|nr:transporter substrate-binding domain-containing protein [Oscillospiraceae bacterium]